MLSLQLKSGDYLTIGDNVVVQVFKETGAQFRVSIPAPREVPILRGQVRERTGTQRPTGLRSEPPKKSPAAQAHANRQLEKLTQRTEARRQAAQTRADAVAAMRAILDRLDQQPQRPEDLAALRTQLDRVAQAEPPA